MKLWITDTAENYTLEDTTTVWGEENIWDDLFTFNCFSPQPCIQNGDHISSKVILKMTSKNELGLEFIKIHIIAQTSFHEYITILTHTIT